MPQEIRTFEELEFFCTSLSSAGIRPGLDRIALLLHRLGAPEKSFPSVHIVGTNGKGSTAAFMESILRASGYRTALYTSPHLESPAERLRIAGRELPLEQWEKAARRIQEVIGEDEVLQKDPPSFFEVITAAAFLLCASERVDIAVIEAGLGGRLDATNLLGNVVLTLVASISMDHTEYLGDTLEAIALEKFAVMRPGIPAFFSGSPSGLVPLFRREALTRGAVPHVSNEEARITEITVTEETLSFRYEGYGLSIAVSTALRGLYQTENCSLAISGAAVLMDSFPRITEKTVTEGIFQTQWPGRFEVLRLHPPLILDGGHNPDGVRHLVDAVQAVYGERKFSVVYTTMRDKEYRECLSLLRSVGRRLYCTTVPGNSRAESPLSLAETARAAGWPEGAISVFEDPLCALQRAEEEGIGTLCCGSLYFIGYAAPLVRSLLERDNP